MELRLDAEAYARCGASSNPFNERERVILEVSKLRASPQLVAQRATRWEIGFSVGRCILGG